MKIGIIPLASEVHDPHRLFPGSNAILEPLKRVFEIKEITISEINQVDFPIVLIQTGGTEHRFKAIFSQLKNTGKPITLLATNTHNSLPASLEILYWITRNGIQNSLLLHGPIESIIAKIHLRARNIEIAGTLSKMKIGVIGKPSDWLISSDIDYEKVKQKWGVTFVDVPLEEVISNNGEFSPSIINETRSIFPAPWYIDGPNDNDISGAIRIYLSLKKIASDYNLSALTLRCFDLLKPLNNTGCLALSRLNDEGFPAGCEGDIPALFTMIINTLITHEPSFMANPSQITSDGIVFAHCTVPMNIVHSFGYKTHFESGTGIGISGEFQSSIMTLSKINGDSLDNYYVVSGEGAPHEESPDLCRTQVKLNIPGNYDYFYKSPLGNHHILSKGDHVDSFVELAQYFSLQKIH